MQYRAHCDLLKTIIPHLILEGVVYASYNENRERDGQERRLVRDYSFKGMPLPRRRLAITLESAQPTADWMACALS